MSKQGQPTQDDIVVKFIISDTKCCISIFDKRTGQGLLFMPAAPATQAKVEKTTPDDKSSIGKKKGKATIPSSSTGLLQRLSEKELRRVKWMLMQE